MNWEQKTKKNLKVCFVLAIIVLAFEVFELSLYIYAKDTGYIIYDSISVALDIYILIIFAKLKDKSMDELIKNQKLLLTTAILTIFASSLLVMIFAFMSYNNLNRYAFAKQVASEDSTIPVEKVEEKQEVLPAEELVSRLKTLQKMKENGEITEDEYEKLKEKMINDFKDETTK